MSSLITRICPRCGHLNTLDLADLKRRDMIIYREEDQEIQVTCANCKQEFVIIIRDRGHA